MKNWKKAKAVQQNQEEIDRIAKLKITGRDADFLNRQKEFRRSVLIRIDLHTALNCLRKKIEHFSRICEETKQSQDEVYYQFGSEYYPVARWITYYNCKLFDYSNALSNEKYLMEALKNDGLTDTQIESIVKDGRYIKEYPKKEDGGNEDGNSVQEPEGKK